MVSYRGIAGVYSFDKKVSKDALDRVIRGLQHRGEPIIIDPCARETNIISSHIALVEIGLNISAEDVANNNILGDIVIVWDGMMDFSPRELHNIPRYVPRGFYSIAMYNLAKDRLIIMRDRIGRKPLYYCKKDEIIVFASERKAIRWLSEPKRLPSRHAAIIENGEISLVRYAEIRQPERSKLVYDEETCINTLCRLLKRSVEKLSPDSVAVIFSGGLDSSTIAWIAKSFSDVELFSVGMRDSRDLRNAERMAKILGITINVREIREEELEDYARETIRAIEEADPLKVLIGIPIYVACEAVRDHGYHIALAGQGADELFGGYAKYLAMSEKELESVLISDLRDLAVKNLERDDHVSMANSVELRLPYLDDELFDFALRVPTSLKTKNGIRKYILRRAAERLGVPREIAYAEKKAIQYSTGVAKHLEKMAKRKKMRLREYVEKLYRETFGTPRPTS